MNDARSKPRRRLLKVLVWIALFGATFYLVVLVALFLLQTRLILPGAGSGPELLPAHKRIALAAASGDRLAGIHIPPGEAPDGTLVLGFGGNAWNADSVANFLHNLYPGAEIVAFHFRGYPPSGGTRGTEALLDDAPRILDLVAKQWPGKRLVVVGFSVGTGPAARLSTDPRVTGAILVTPFDSLLRVARSHYPWAPVGLLLRHRLEPGEDVRRPGAPVAIVGAERDEIIPAWSTEALRQGTDRLVFHRIVPAAGHNSIYQHPEFEGVMRAALEAVAAPAQSQ